MKPARTGALSGCVIWFIVFCVLSSCLIPAAMMIGGFSSVTRFAMQTVGPLVCPEGTTVESRSYATTTTDEFGNPQPSTAFVLQCVDANGVVIKEDPVLYAFIWIGIVSIIGLILAAILAFVFAAPAGVLIARLTNRKQKGMMAENIEPR
ncbi:MAG: hypothetical protein HUU11_13305 [Anaerolineales bacterium]|nr:hypothetical protein [Anaerolineales bacterium]NUQ85684.1 hypothetical protein [Anaerolineales bacterium]